MANLQQIWTYTNTLSQPIHAIKSTKFRNKCTPAHCPQIKRGKQPSTSKIEGESKVLNFEEFLLDAVDDGLSLLGESGKQVVYYHLEKNFKIKRQDIPFKIEEFTDAIERIFGIGAKILEIKIMQCLFKRGGYTFRTYPKQPNLTFIDYITTIKLATNNYANRKERLLDHKQNGKNKMLCVQTRQ